MAGKILARWFYHRVAPHKERSSVNPHKLRRVLEQNFELVASRSNSEEVTIICEEPGCHDKSGNCAINLKKGLVHCWVCNYSAHIIPFLHKHEIELDADALEDVVDTEDYVGDLAADPPPVEHTPIELPKGFTPLSADHDSVYARMIGQMAQRKHLYFQDFVDAGVGYTRFGSWEPYAIFPVYELGKLVYYQGRTYAPRFEGGTTKKFPSKKVVPLGAGNWLYGYDQAVQPGVEVVVVLESMLNVLSLRWELQCQGIQGVVPVAVFKHKISQVQYTKLMASPAKEICIIYDGDATASAWEEAKKLSGTRLATVATMPVGIDANDDAKLALAQFAKRQQYSPANALTDSLGL